MPAPDPLSPRPEAAGAAGRRVQMAEAALVLLGLLYAFGLHAQAIRAQRWNSDEPQHLHIVWAWTQGLLPYRDVFDNHTPLFSWLCSPLLRALGERPDIVEPMRVAMLPLFALSLWFVYRIGASVFSKRIGMWAALLASLWPSWTGKMVEFRTDIFWTTLWLGVLAVLVGGRLTPKRAVFAGFLLGAAFCTSMKTVLLLLNLLVAGGAVLLFLYRVGTAEERAGLAVEKGRLALWFVAGLLALPAAWLCFFAAKGALGDLYYCIITHNVVPKHETTGRHLIRSAWIVGLLAAAWLLPPGAVKWLAPERSRQAAALFMLMLTISFHPLVRGLWTKVTDQDYLPYFPILALMVAFAGAGLLPRLLPARGVARFVPTLLLACVAARYGFVIYPKRTDLAANRERIEALADLLNLTRPGEYVMDAKGESIFRPRPYHYVIETFTRQRLHNGSLPEEELPRRLQDTNTAVLFGEMLVPESTRAFFTANYLPVTPPAPRSGERRPPSPFAVAGKLLPSGPDAQHATVEIAIPQSYRAVAEHGSVEGRIDGLPLAEAHWLAAGPHRIELTNSGGRAALIWSRAAERGYRPF